MKTILRHLPALSSLLLLLVPIVLRADLAPIMQ
jgi:hypothetical protein